MRSGLGVCRASALRFGTRRLGLACVSNKDEFGKFPKPPDGIPSTCLSLKPYNLLVLITPLITSK